MKLVISFMLLSHVAYSCQLKKEFEFAVLSSAVASIFKQLDLQTSPHIKYAFDYFNVGGEESQKVLGGIFLSSKSIKDNDKLVIFYDHSEDLKSILIKKKVNRLIAFESRQKDPFIFTQEVLKTLQGFWQSCEKKTLELKEKINKIKQKALNSDSFKAVFFLGKVESNKKLPPTIMVQDGFVKFLKNSQVLKTYPSELAYFPWSQKTIKKLMEKNYQFIGLNHDKGTSFRVEKSFDQHINIYSEDALLPGLSQIFFLESLMNFLAK